jgi:hypothetical protein
MVVPPAGADTSLRKKPERRVLHCEQSMAMGAPRRLVKYAGIVLCMAILAAGVASCWRGAAAEYAASVGFWSVALVAGEVWYSHYEMPARRTGWSGRTFHHTLPSSLTPRWKRLPKSLDWALPLWIPFLLLVLPTTVLFCLDRRSLSGQCPRCAYDLAGIATGVCPECGHTATNDRP